MQITQNVEKASTFSDIRHTICRMFSDTCFDFPPAFIQRLHNGVCTVHYVWMVYVEVSIE